MSDEPTTLPLAVTRDPFARFDIVTCEMPVTTSGYTNPSSTVSTTVMSNPVTNWRRSITWLLRYAIPGSAASAPSVHSERGDDDVDELDSDERSDDAAQSVDEEIATEDR